MPTYEYHCTTCDINFDIIQSFSEDRLAKCPNGKDAIKECATPGKGKLEKVFSAPAIIFKGQGFYKTDSSSSSAKTTASEGESKTPKEAKPAKTKDEKSSDTTKASK